MPSADASADASATSEDLIDLESPTLHCTVQCNVLRPPHESLRFRTHAIRRDNRSSRQLGALFFSVFETCCCCCPLVHSVRMLSMSRVSLCSSCVHNNTVRLKHNENVKRTSPLITGAHRSLEFGAERIGRTGRDGRQVFCVL